MNIPLGIASPALAATPLPEGHDTSALYLRTFLLNCQLAVKANEVARHQMLKNQLHAFVAERFGDALDAMVEDAAIALYDRLTAKEESEDEWPEQEADEPDGSLPLDLPGPEYE